MSEVRSYSLLSEPLSGGYSFVFMPSFISEPLSGGDPEVQSASLLVEPLTGGQLVLQAASFLNEPLTGGLFILTVASLIDEVLMQSPEELNVSTEVFPGFGNSPSNPAIPQAADPFNSPLKGLTFAVNKKPMFKTRISEAASGNEVRSSTTQYPRWDFTLRYDFLEDRTGAESSLKTLMGFFLSRRGSFQSWLFKDPDDFSVENGDIGMGDGLTVSFPMVRGLGGFFEKVGQVDLANPVTVYLSPPETHTIPITPGPFIITVDNASSFVEDLGVTRLGVPMTRVTGTPATGQYSVSSGVYTFASGNNNQEVVITYRYEVSTLDYSIIAPNILEFGVAPAAGRVSASFQYFFACRFLEDEMDFEKFMDKLWSLQECTFRSILQ